MIDTEKMSEEAKARAVEAGKPGTFSFVDRLAGRSYPSEDVVIYLDEAAGHKIETLLEDRANQKDGEQVNLIDKQIDALREKAAHSRFVVTVQGISNEDYDAVVDAARDEFPYEYRESRHPLTMALQREIIDNPDREQYFRTHSWAKFIRKVVAPDGSVDENITPEWVGVLFNHAPLMALAKIGMAIDRVRMTVEWMDRLQDEDFLAKS